jgi:hypothetical protein
MTFNAFEVLGVWHDTPEPEIREAYRNRVEACEARAAQGDPEAARERGELDEALRILLSPLERGLHEHMLRGGTAVPIANAPAVTGAARPEARQGQGDIALALAGAAALVLLVPIVHVVRKIIHQGDLPFRLILVTDGIIALPLIACFLLGCAALMVSSTPIQAEQRARIMRHQGRHDETAESYERWAAEARQARTAVLIARGALALDAFLFVWFGLVRMV